MTVAAKSAASEVQNAEQQEQDHEHGPGHLHPARRGSVFVMIKGRVGHGWFLSCAASLAETRRALSAVWAGLDVLRG